MRSFKLNYKYLLLILVGSFMMSACSTLKKKCEQTNWFDYAQKIALKGERLDTDSFYQQCIKKEAQIDEMSADQGFKKGMNIYCEADAPFSYGKNGKTYNFDFCGHLNTQKMKQGHKKGLRIYCLPKNGYPEGITGKVYNKLCPEDMESSFLVGFNTGRVKYLKAEVLDKASLISDLKTEIRRKEREYAQINDDLRYLDRYYGRNERVIIIPGRIIISPRSQRRLETKEDFASERSRLEGDLRSVKYSIRVKENELRSLQDEKRKLEKEIILLE